MPGERQQAIDAAARLLRHGDRSRAELEQRLARRGIEPDAVQAALETLERVGVLDEVRTAELRAARLAERGYGNAYIRAELERRGLPAEAVLAELEPETERAARVDPEKDRLYEAEVRQWWEEGDFSADRAACLDRLADIAQN